MQKTVEKEVEKEKQLSSTSLVVVGDAFCEPAVLYHGKHLKLDNYTSLLTVSPNAVNSDYKKMLVGRWSWFANPTFVRLPQQWITFAALCAGPFVLLKSSVPVVGSHPPAGGRNDGT